MEPSIGRSLLWNGLAGLGTGFACTIVTALYAGGEDCSSRRVATALLVCSPLLATVPGLLTSSPRLKAGSAAVATGGLAILMGALNAVVVWLGTRTLEGQDYRELGTVLVFSIPFGGIPGAGYALPLAFASWFGRKAAAAERPVIGAGRGLLAIIAVVGAATSMLVASVRGGSYSAWPALLAFDAALAAACLWTAARDIGWAVWLRRIELDPAGKTRFAPAVEAPAVGLRRLAGGFGPPAPTHVLRVQAQDPTTPYRTSDALRPFLALDVTPARVRRALIAGAALLLVCAGLLGWSATQMPGLERRPVPTCPLFSTVANEDR